MSRMEPPQRDESRLEVSLLEPKSNQSYSHTTKKTNLKTINSGRMAGESANHHLEKLQPRDCACTCHDHLPVH